MYENDRREMYGEEWMGRKQKKSTIIGFCGTQSTYEVCVNDKP